jgi:hypothetical protein
MNTIALTINGTTRTYLTGSLSLLEQTNARGSLSLIVQSLDGSFRPAKDEEVIVTLSGTRIFGGIVEEFDETGIGGESAGNGLEFNINVADFNSFADRRFVVAGLASGTVKSFLQALDDYVTPYGVTLDGAQIDGPTIPTQVWDVVLFSEVLNNIMKIASGIGTAQAWIWEIDYNKVLRAFGVLESGHAAPFNITATSPIIGDVVVRPSRTDFANHVIVMFGTGQQAVVDIMTADGVATAFDLHYNLIEHGGAINVGGTVTAGVISGGTNETIGPTGSGATWIFDPNTTDPGVITRSTGAPAAGPINLPYLAAFPSKVRVDSGAALSARVERKFDYPDIFDHVIATAIADALLVQSLVSYKEVVYSIPTAGARPGMTQTITLPKHGISGSHIIISVRTHDEMETQLTYEITAFGGTGALSESWMETYKMWGQSGGSAAGGTPTVVTNPSIRQSFFLGGNESLYVQSPTPTWVAADAVQVTIDTAVRGTTTGTVYARVRAASGNVTARLYNITDSTVAGTGTLKSSSSWTSDSFAVTLAAGSKVYQLQVLPGTANVDVAGTGHFV